jgi:hypothetical protein
MSASHGQRAYHRLGANIWLQVGAGGMLVDNLVKGQYSGNPMTEAEETYNLSGVN